MGKHECLVCHNKWDCLHKHEFESHGNCCKCMDWPVSKQNDRSVSK